MDTSAVSTYVSGTDAGKALRAELQGQRLVITGTVYDELRVLRNKIEFSSTSKADKLRRFMDSVTIIPNIPSARARTLKSTRSLSQNDIDIFGTYDNYDIRFVTADEKALRAAAVQHVDFDAITCPATNLYSQG
jgi:hypothetical protein